MSFKRAFLPIGMAAALVFSGPAITLGAGAVLDQQVTTSNNAVAVAGAFVQAQVFTAGITGNLTAFDVLVTTGGGPGKPSADLTVQLWTVTGGAPDHAIDGTTATILAADVPNGAATWVNVPVKAHSVVGGQYAIVLSAPGASLGDCPGACWSWLDDDSGPYASGPSFWSTDGGATWPAQGRDYDFKTYVLPLFNLQVYLSGVGDGANGSVTSADPGIDCGATCLALYSEARTVTLTAHPAITATFGYWQGGPCDQSHNPVCSFLMPAQNVETGATFYGIEPTPPPGPTPTPSHAATPRPSSGASPSASIDASGGPSDEPSPAVSEGASLSPGSSPGPSASPSTIPTGPASDSDGSILPIALGLVVLIVLLGGALFMSRRRLTGAPPPDAGAPPPPSE